MKRSLIVALLMLLVAAAGFAANPFIGQWSAGTVQFYFSATVVSSYGDTSPITFPGPGN